MYPGHLFCIINTGKAQLVAGGLEPNSAAGKCASIGTVRSGMIAGFLVVRSTSPHSIIRVPQYCEWVCHCCLLSSSIVAREYAFSWTHVLRAKCHLLIFFCSLFFFLKRDLKRGNYISATFELSWWTLTHFLWVLPLLYLNLQGYSHL